LDIFPIMGVHMPGIRTKVSRRLAADLLRLSSPAVGKLPVASAQEDTDKDSNKATMTMYVNDLLDVVRKELISASREGDKYTYSQRMERMLRKAGVRAIKSSVRAFVEDWVDRFGSIKEAEECLSTPANERIRSSNMTAMETIEPRDLTNTTTPLQRVLAPLITPHVDLTEDNDEADFDIVLSRLKEETILQNLLHKRFLNNERVLQLEHRNGRRLRVILYPDALTTKSFVDEAKKSQWVNQMLYKSSQKEGMLVYLLKTAPDIYFEVAASKKLRVTVTVLDTAETLALGRLTGINDT